MIRPTNTQNSLSEDISSPETLFAAALDHAGAAERCAFLDEACAGNQALRQEVESLLAAHEHAGGFMKTGNANLPRPGAPVEKSGDRIGRYKLLEQIGEGGFGVVWMAEQREPVRRLVAVKLIKAGMDSQLALAGATGQLLGAGPYDPATGKFVAGGRGRGIPGAGCGGCEGYGKFPRPSP